MVVVFGEKFLELLLYFSRTILALTLMPRKLTSFAGTVPWIEVLVLQEASYFTDLEICERIQPHKLAFTG